MFLCVLKQILHKKKVIIIQLLVSPIFPYCSVTKSSNSGIAEALRLGPRWLTPPSPLTVSLTEKKIRFLTPCTCCTCWHLYVFSPKWVTKCLLKWHALTDVKSHQLQLCEFSQESKVKCVVSLLTLLNARSFCKIFLLNEFKNMFFKHLSQQMQSQNGQN